jgi:2-C-methyl-D-erythritol 4-phosphate cytidylyltransferase
VERSGDITAALAEAHQKSGRIDFVVNTAGVLRIGALGELEDADIDEAINVNYLAPVHIARAALPYLREVGGSLLLFTSSSYTRGRANYSLYSSTKAAVVNLTQALADEWSEIGVRVNCVNPERTSTPMRTRAFGEEPATSLLSAEAVAETSVDVLISDMTGAIVDVRRIPEPRTEELSPTPGDDDLDLDITDLVGTR